MQLKDIKTLITSGTILVAVALYMIFGNPPPEKSEGNGDAQSNAIISIEEAQQITGNKAIPVD